jgi:putative transposase
MQKWRPWETADQAEWQVALTREAVIRPLLSETKLGVSLLREATRQLHVSRSVFYDLLRRYKQRPQTSSLLPWKRGREFQATFLGAPREELLNACIREFYLRLERPSVAALVREVQYRFSQQGLAVPNWRTIRRRIEALDLKILLQKREGSKKAWEQIGHVSVSSLKPENPMEILQIDHTRVDVIVVDQEQRLPIGRPWLTLAIDVTTRMVAGFHVSLWAPSTLSLCLALSHAVLHKDSWLADRELHNLEWPAAGLPQIIHVDNAKEFHSDVLVRGCQEYGIQLDHRPIGRPHFGGHIERLIGTMMGAVHLLPGTTFSNVDQKGAYDSEKRALLTLPELERWLALQIAGVYHLSVHSALRMTPLEAWKTAVGKTSSPLRYPADGTDFLLDFLPAVPRQIRRDGIHLNNIRYWDNVLSPWAGRLKQPLLVKYDPRNLSRIYVRDPHGRHWPVPYADLGQPPVALWELEEARKRLRQRGASVPFEQAIFASILEQREIVRKSATTSRQRRTKERIPAASEAPRTNPLTPRSSTATTAEIKAFPVEIWERE